MNTMKHELFEQATQFVISRGYCDGKELMEHFKIGYNSSGRLIDELEDCKIVAPFNGSKRRDLITTK